MEFTRAGYTPELVQLVRQTCLYVFTRLGDLTNELVVVGGLVPSLIISQDPPPEGDDKHLGTRDLDLGLALGVFEEERYRLVAERLREAGFQPDVNPEGNGTLQRWTTKTIPGATIDFLIPQSTAIEEGGTLKHLEVDLAAIVTPGLELAFEDRMRVSLSGTTLLGESAQRDVWVCGPGAYVVLNALAFRSRGKDKDAYDLYYVVRNFGRGLGDVAAHLAPLVGRPHAAEAIAVLKQDFTEPDGIGPMRVARFLYSEPNPATQTDVAGFVRQLLSLCQS
jgi:hypothetical protein